MNVKLTGLLGIITMGLTLATTSVIMASEPMPKILKVPGGDIAQTQQNATTDKQQIIRAIQLDDQPAPPQAPARVDDLVIESPYAIATILYGEEGGGMAALKKEQGIWKVVGGGGGAFNSTYLVELGFPPKTAQSLMKRMEAQWSRQ